MLSAAEENDSTAALDVRIIEDRSAFEALEGPWEQLDGQPGVRPFQEFGWCAAWVRTIGAAGGWGLRVGTLWQQGRLVAVMPLCVRRYKGIRILEWIGARVTDYCDALVDSRVSPDAVLPILWKAIVRRGGFDVARLSHVRTDARVYGVLSESNPWIETVEDAGGVPITWATDEQWLAQLSKGMRERVKYNFRRMQREGFEVRFWEPPHPCDHILDVLVAQKRPWLAERGLSSFIDQPEGVAFLHAVVKHTASRGEIYLSMVQSPDNQIAAIDLTFYREGVLYSYLGSFEPRFAKYSFGRILTDYRLMKAAHDGVTRMDLLLGAYDYKTEYGCTLEPVRTLVIPRGLLGHAAVSVYRRRGAASTSIPSGT